jgi:hypothetical protein
MSTATGESWLPAGQFLRRTSGAVELWVSPSHYSLMMPQTARRMTAAVLTLLLAEFTLAGNGDACIVHATHVGQEETTHAHSATHHSPEMQPEISHVAPAHEPATLGPCDVPCAPATCVSAVTCGLTAAALAVSDLSPPAFASADAVAPDALVPRSLTTAPEPPPPRA